MRQIQPPSTALTSLHPVLNLGYRVFFSGRAVFAIITMALWSVVYTGNTHIDANQINPLHWYAHEMLNAMRWRLSLGPY